MGAPGGWGATATLWTGTKLFPSTPFGRGGGAGEGKRRVSRGEPEIHLAWSLCPGFPQAPTCPDREQTAAPGSLLEQSTFAPRPRPLCDVTMPPTLGRPEELPPPPQEVSKVSAAARFTPDRLPPRDLPAAPPREQHSPPQTCRANFFPFTALLQSPHPPSRGALPGLHQPRTCTQKGGGSFAWVSQRIQARRVLPLP